MMKETEINESNPILYLHRSTSSYIVFTQAMDYQESKSEPNSIPQHNQLPEQ